MLMLVTAVAVHAQSLTGKQWCTVLNDEDTAKALPLPSHSRRTVPAKS